MTYFLPETYNVLDNRFSGGADPTGTADSTAAIQAALTAAGQKPGTAVYFPSPATYATTSPLSVPTSVTMFSDYTTWPIPTGNYGVGGIPVSGAVIQPMSSFTGSAVINLGKSGASQAGGMSIRNIAVNGTNLTSSTHGIMGASVGGVVLQDVLVYKMTADGLHVAGTSPDFTPPDFFRVDGCKFSDCGAWGVNIAGLADSFFSNSESTGNGTGGGWLINNGGDTRFIACRGSSNGNVPGWCMTSSTSFTGIVQFIGCEANLNGTGIMITGSGSGTYRLVSFTCHGNTALYSYSGTNHVESLAAWNTSPTSPTLT